MNVRRALAPLALAVLVSAAGCTRDVDFDFTQTYVVTTTANAFSAVQPVDLAQEAGTAWEHRSRLKSLTVRFIDGEVLSTGTTQGQATLLSASAKFRPEGTDGSADVALGSAANVPVTQGTTLTLVPSAAANAAINGAIKGTGRFGLVLDATSDRPVTGAEVRVTVGVKVEYSTNPF